MNSLKLSLLICIILLLAGCSSPAAVAQATTAADVAAAQAVETVSAQLTSAAVTPTRKPRTATPTMMPINTLRPSATTLPTFTPVTTVGPAPTITLDPALAGCDVVRVVKDVTIPEGFYIAPAMQFTKTWRLQNNGSCTWLSGLYELVFDSGDQLNAPLSVKLPANVLPGEMVDVSVTLKSPENHGHYRGYWKLRNPSGLTFGQDGGLKPFYVDINVGNTSVDLRYDFLGFFCQAEWRTGGGRTLPCIGKDGDPNGFVRVLARPVLEDGTIDDEAALLTNPPAHDDGQIMGIFPEFTVRPGDHFLAVIGCEFEAVDCNVTFELNYQIGDGPIQNYAHWVARYDKKFEVLDIDLKDLGKTTLRFVLSVKANGPSNGNRALWLKPRLKHFTPSATSTPTVTPRP